MAVYLCKATVKLAVLVPCLQLGLVDCQSATGNAANIRYIPLPSEPGAPMSLPLADVMPLDAFLAPVGTCKERIAAALDEHLTPSTASGTQSASVSGNGYHAAIADGSFGAPHAEQGMQRGGTLASDGSGTAAPGRGMRLGSGSNGCRGLGPALLALLEYLKDLEVGRCLSLHG